MRRPGRIHLILFAATLVTTHAAGALWEGAPIWDNPLLIWRGWAFALPLLAILGTHEFGHYFAARRHRVDVSLPYFIPAPTIIGTFGAVIRMRSMPPDRRSLLDIGAAGPVAGLVLAVIVVYAGLHQSRIADAAAFAQPGAIEFGEPLLFRFLSWTVFGRLRDGQVVVIGATAFAGWVGLFVTALNLLPIGQLDGGHILLAVFPGRAYRAVSSLFLAGLLILGAFRWTGWLVMAGVGFFLGALGRHPAAALGGEGLDGRRRLLAALSAAIFALTFVPEPIRIP